MRADHATGLPLNGARRTVILRDNDALTMRPGVISILAAQNGPEPPGPGAQGKCEQNYRQPGPSVDAEQRGPKDRERQPDEDVRRREQPEPDALHVAEHHPG